MPARVSQSELYDVYFSAADPEMESARALVEALSKRGLSIWWIENELAHADDISRSIAEGLARSRVFLALHSRAYAYRRTGQAELMAAVMAGRRDGDLTKRLLLLADEDAGVPLVPDELSAAIVGSIPQPANRRAIAGITRRVQTQLEGLTTAMARGNEMSPPPRHGSRGDGSPRFVGRSGSMWSLHDALRGDVRDQGEGARPETVVLHGLRGVGKSMLAEEYAFRFGSLYPGGVFWLRAFGTDDPVTGMGTEEREAERDRQIREFAGDLGVIIANRSPFEIRVALADALARRAKPCLWVVDDLPAGLDDEAFVRWIGPHPLAKTLVTTRDADYARLGKAMELGVLEGPEAIELLTVMREAGDPKDASVFSGLANVLGRHPIAVSVTGAGLTSDDEQSSLVRLVAGSDGGAASREEFGKSLAGQVPAGHETAIATALMCSMDDLAEEGRDFMRLASVLAAAPITLSLYRAVLSRLDADEDEDALAHAAIGQAAARALTERPFDEDSRHVSVHPLIAEAARFVEATPARLETLRGAAVAALMDLLPANYDPTAYAAVEFEIAHARALVKRPNTAAEAELLGRVARYDLVRGAYESAQRLYERQVDAYEGIHGPSHGHTAAAMSDLAGTLFLRGEVAEARALHEKVVAIRKEVLGVEGDETLVSMSNLAALLAVEGDHAAARAIQEEVVEIRRGTAGHDAPATLTAMNNLAATLAAQGDLEAVRELQEEVLRVRRRALGPEHPHTTTSAWQLYNTLTGMQDEGEANLILRKHLTWLLDRDEQTLGPQHLRIRALIQGR